MAHESTRDQFSSVIGDTRGNSKNDSPREESRERFVVNTENLRVELTNLHFDRDPDAVALTATATPAHAAAHDVCRRLSQLTGALVGPYGMAVRVLPVTELAYARQLVTVTVGPTAQMHSLPGQSPGVAPKPEPVETATAAGVSSNPMLLSAFTGVDDFDLVGGNTGPRVTGVDAFIDVLENVATVATNLIPAARAIERAES